MGGTIALTWMGSLWMVFWAGFDCQLAVAAIAHRLGDRAQLVEHQRLLQKLDAGQVESARNTLKDAMELDRKFMGIDKRMPKFDLMDIALAGIRNPGAGIALIQSARASEARSLPSRR